MEIMPHLELGLCNGWLLAAILYLVFGALLLIFPRPVVVRLYERPRRTGSTAIRRLLGVPWILAWLALVILTPLARGLVLAGGLALYGAGLAGFVLALLNYAATPVDQPVTSGLYRISRHPQQFMLSVASLGISLAIGSWLALALMAVGVLGGHAKVIEEERACLEKYGASYREYMERVPRYFLFF